MATEFIIQANPPREALVDLLKLAGLPFADLDTLEDADFYGLWQGGTLVGSVGLERYATCGLLRSLAVAEPAQHRRLGARLLQTMEAHARDTGITVMHLLTTDAQGYFERAGYRSVERSTAPMVIRNTQQFAALCPGDATFMVKALSLA